MSPLDQHPATWPRLADVRELLQVALPVVTVQVGMMAMGVVDTIMVGHVSPIALAAVALGNLYFFTVAIFGLGTLMALDPVVAQAVGAGDEPAIARGLQRGMLLALGLSLLASALLLPAGPVLRLCRQSAEIVPVAAVYSRISVIGIPGFFAFVVFRQTLQAMGRMRPIVWTIVGANLANVALNWVLIYGHLGAPALGAVGSALATAISRWLMGLGLLAAAWRLLRPYLHPLRAEVFTRAPLMRMLRLGIPIGLQQQVEYGVFGLIGLLMGSLGTAQMAGHQVALNLASLTFMVPLGLSGAAAIVVGQAIGREEPDHARRAAAAALGCAIGFMSFSALVLVLAPKFLGRVYTESTEVLAVAVVLIPIAGVFQIFDGIQVTSIGILRGLGDTRAPIIIGLLGFWLLGLPVSLYLGFRTRMGPAGLWWGLVVGLAAVAIFLLARVRARLRGDLTRLHIDLPLTPLPPLP